MNAKWKIGLAFVNLIDSNSYEESCAITTKAVLNAAQEFIPYFAQLFVVKTYNAAYT